MSTREDEIQRRIERSETRISKAVFPPTTNHHNTLFGGTALAWMDEVSFITATRFCRLPLVTVSSDRIDFNHPIAAGSIVELVGRVIHVGNTSMKVSVEVFDPRTVYPLDWAGLAASLERTGRLVVIDDSNRACGLGAEILATAAEEMRLIAPPRRVTRPDGAVLPFAEALDRALQPSRVQLATCIQAVMKNP